jgi:hypothetical protein
MTRPLDKSKLVNADDELFWRNVREMHDLVARDNSKTFEFAVGDKHAKIYVSKKFPETIVVAIDPHTPTPPTLIVPPGGNQDD